MQGDARSSTHPLQQPVATEGEANNAFDEITYKKGQSIIRMLESFLGEEVFRDGIRKYMAAHKFSNTTTADLWQALTEVSGKPVGEIAPGWTEQPGFPLVKVERKGNRIQLSQGRFTVHFPDAPVLSWQIPLTYFTQDQPTPKSFLLRDKRATLPNEFPEDRAIKFNVADNGYYRVQYDSSSWSLLVAQMPRLSETDRVHARAWRWSKQRASRSRTIWLCSTRCWMLTNSRFTTRSATPSFSSTACSRVIRFGRSSSNMRAGSCARHSIAWAGNRSPAKKSRRLYSAPRSFARLVR